MKMRDSDQSDGVQASRLSSRGEGAASTMFVVKSAKGVMMSTGFFKFLY